MVRALDGRANGVRYEELSPMLLNEMQKIHKDMAELKRDMQEALALQRTADIWIGRPQ